MTAKPVRLLAQADQELRQVTAWYRREGGQALALEWADAVAASLRHVGANPQAGSPRYAVVLNLPGLRFWQMSRFPYLVFYVEYEDRVDIWRVLHAQRDVPAWMGEGESQ